MHNRGFAIVSVVAAVVILAVALTSAVSVYVSASRLGKKANELTTASNYVEGVLERAKSTPYDAVVSASIVEGLPKLPGATCEMKVEQPEPGLKSVTVTCSWRDGKRTRTASLATLIARGGTR